MTTPETTPQTAPQTAPQTTPTTKAPARSRTTKPAGKVRTGDPKADRAVRDAAATAEAAKTTRTSASRKPATAPEEAPVKANGYHRYATAEIPSAMTKFSAWIEREFPDLKPVDPRLVTIASKAYRYFQSSDLNR